GQLGHFLQINGDISGNEGDGKGNLGH
ncbi:hypothetical protein CCACVL1_00687, partial [Corchorus capsularis]